MGRGGYWRRPPTGGGLGLKGLQGLDMDLGEERMEKDQLKTCTLEGALCWIGRHCSVEVQRHGGEIGLTGG